MDRTEKRRSGVDKVTFWDVELIELLSRTIIYNYTLCNDRIYDMLYTTCITYREGGSYGYIEKRDT